MSEQEYKGLHFKPEKINPQGKQKVYFCCHEADFSAFLEPIMEEIRAIQPNVTFWYYDPAEGIPSGEAFLADLSQMQLFVIPVTYRFIYKDTPARTVEFQYAIDHHIPVLPLMQEPGLEEEFNRVCGDLQLLDKYASQNDPTALPYEEKLKKFLQSVLISDELAQQIRDAFDAYVFLSYRKKDRQYAQKIMSLIHDNEYCRDVAIWYDEFLTPGENFNKAIQKALDKSKLFALVVTPNLLEKNNYVAEHEYPAAKESNKTIAPIKAKETDLNELGTMFPGIESCLSEEEIGNHFHELFHEVALREDRNDPKHEFFMGLAYLGGIDVEVNHERALELITAAAEANLPEAYEKIVSMYQNGEGVERNYHTAIEWQQKYADHLKEIADGKPTERTLANYYISLISLGDYQTDVGDINGAKQSYANSLLSAQKLLQLGSSDSQRKMSLSYGNLGKICEAESNLSEAKEWYQKSSEIDEILTEETETVESLRHLAVTYNNLGIISEFEAALLEAKKWHQKALEIFKRIEEKTGTVESLIDLSSSYNCLGRISEYDNHYLEAREWYKKSFDIRNKLAKDIKTTAVFRVLSNSCENLGIISEKEGYLLEAGRWHMDALKIRKGLAEQENRVQDFTYLANSYNNLGNISLDFGDYSEARVWHQQALDIRKKLAEQTATVQSLRDLAISFSSLGLIEEKEKKFSEAKEWYQKSFEIRKRLAEKTETEEEFRYLSLGYCNFGRLGFYEGHVSEAKEWYQRSLEVYDRYPKMIRTKESLRQIQIIYKIMGKLCESEGNPREAQEWYRKANDIIVD